VRISEYVKHMQDLATDFGDLEVFQGDYTMVMGAIRPAGLPRVKEVAKLLGGERQARYVVNEKDEVRRTGCMVVYVGK
jgi:hypothetical protein